MGTAMLLHLIISYTEPVTPPTTVELVLLAVILLVLLPRLPYLHASRRHDALQSPPLPGEDIADAEGGT